MPTPDPRNIQWSRLNDFSSGIADRDYRASGAIGPWPLGTARADKTFRCRALPNGALGPLPRRDNSFSFPYPPDVDIATNPNVLVNGFLIQGPVQAPGATTGYDEANWLVATEYLSTAGGAGRRQSRLHRVQMWLSARPRDQLYDKPDAFAGGIHRTCWLESSRISDTDPTMPGFPVVCFAWYGDAPGGGSNNTAWGFWPDPANPTSNDPRYVDEGNYTPAPMIVYQGRSMICDRHPYDNGPDSAKFSLNEELYFTRTNLAELYTVIASVFTPEDPGEIMAIAVSNANELFVLKRRQGAYVIRGDIVLPTALRLPGIMGAGKMTGRPLPGPFGVLYTSLGSGVYVWPGGEESQLISGQLEPNNFEYDLEGPWEFQENFGRPDFFQDLVFIVPGFVYDWRRQAWWRLEDPADTEAPNGYLYFQKSLSKRSIIGVRGEYKSGEDYAFAYNFDAGATSYQWNSQPLPFSIDRDIEVREIVLRATGVNGSTVTITLSARGATPQTQVFTLTGSDYPRIMRSQFAVLGGDVEVKIVADSNAVDQPAPIVYGVDIGYYDTQLVPETPV